MAKVRSGPSERDNRGGGKHGEEVEGIPGLSWRSGPSPAASTQAGGGLARGRARRARAFVLLAGEEDDREEARWAEPPGGLASWAATGRWPGKFCSFLIFLLFCFI